MELEFAASLISSNKRSIRWPVFDGEEHNRRIRHEGEIHLQLFAVLLHRLVILGHGIPFVDRNDTALARLVRQARHLGILIRKANRRVDHDHTDVGSLDSHLSPQDTVTFDGILHLVLSPQTSGVDEGEFSEAVFNRRVNRIARGSRDIGNNAAFLSGNPVDKGAFSDIRLTDHGNTDFLSLRLFPFVLLRQIFKHTVKQVACPVACTEETATGSPRPRL